MDIKVRDLKQTETIENDDKLMVLVDDNLNLVKNISKEEFLTNVISETENNALEQSTDGNLYVNTKEIADSVTALDEKVTSNIDTINANMGDLADLETEDKTNLVAAINEASTKGSGAGGSGFSLFDLVQKDHVLSFDESKGFAQLGTYVYKEAVAGSRYGYPDFYNTVVAEFQDEENTTTTVGGVTVSVNSNGHKFYDIANKSAIDSMYNSTGEAWYYGVDTVNERVFLPRSTRFKNAQSAGEVGEYQEAGLPNITGTFNQDITLTTGAFYNTKKTSASGSNGGGSIDDVIGFDASRSSSIYGASDTVEYSSTKLFVYMVTGNTDVTSAITDVTDITTSENDTIPLGFSTYSGDVLDPKLGWLKSSGQWNSGEVFSTFYNKAVTNIGNGFANGSIVEYTDSYTDYDLVINQEDMTFRLPLKNGTADDTSSLGLYFKVNNAVQNLELLDVGKVMEAVNSVIPNNSSLIAGYGMPSTTKYVDLTLGASGTTYTAPANGYVLVGKVAGATYYYVNLYSLNNNGDTLLSNWSGEYSTSPCICFIPVYKGQVYGVNYNATGKTLYFKFIYAQGSESEA